MKTISMISSILILSTFVFASDAKTGIPKHTEGSKNVGSVKQLMKSELAPIDVEQIKKTRIEKSIRHKKHADAILKNLESSEQKQNELLEKSALKFQNRDILKKWSKDIHSKLPVSTLKIEDGKKIIKLPLTPKSN